MTEASRTPSFTPTPPPVVVSVPHDVRSRHADILRIGNRAALAVQEANRRRGIANWYSLRGYLVSDAKEPVVSVATGRERPAV